MLVIKIKGAVMQDAEALSEVIGSVDLQAGACVAVVSAPESVKARLRGMWRQSLRRGAGFEGELRALAGEFEGLAERLLPEEAREAFRVEAEAQWAEVLAALEGVAAWRGEAERMRDYVVAKGDVVASMLFRRAAGSACWRDARNFIVTDENFGAPEIAWEESCRAAEEAFRGLAGLAVVPGGCGKTRAGYTISLGAVGLELTAAVLEAALHERKVA